jgi:hypothetical protein
MPRNVRNFYVTTTVDGRQTDDASGPRGKAGGFWTAITQRSEGEIVYALLVKGDALPDGSLVLTVKDREGNTIFQHRTER